MKGMLFAIAGLGVGGATYFGLDGPDFDRVIKKSPMSVYSAFSALAPEGTRTERGSDASGGRSVTLKVVKERGESLVYEISFDNRPVVTAELTFAPAGEGGGETRMTAELELDEYEIGSAFENDAGMALSLIPEGLIDMQFANFMDDMVRDVEAGRPLPPLAMNRTGIRRSGDTQSLTQRRYEAEEARRQASRPRSGAARPNTTARPMADPNRAAANFRNGEPENDDPRGIPGGWGR